MVVFNQENLPGYNDILADFWLQCNFNRIVKHKIVLYLVCEDFHSSDLCFYGFFSPGRPFPMAASIKYMSITKININYFSMLRDERFPKLSKKNQNWLSELKACGEGDWVYLKILVNLNHQSCVFIWMLQLFSSKQTNNCTTLNFKKFRCNKRD